MHLLLFITTALHWNLFRREGCCCLFATASADFNRYPSRVSFWMSFKFLLKNAIAITSNTQGRLLFKLVLLYLSFSDSKSDFSFPFFY